MAQCALRRRDKPLPVDTRILELSHDHLNIEKALSHRVSEVTMNTETGWRMNDKLQSDRLMTLLTRPMQQTPENYPYMDMNKVTSLIFGLFFSPILYHTCCFCCLCCLNNLN